ncbi:hypothetical protein [Endozoicomonas sp. ALB122]|uniref:hypothetical protein n=3 Tax=Endozoicomonas TaxID=305899 RepID=UPI003BB7162E
MKLGMTGMKLGMMGMKLGMMGVKSFPQSFATPTLCVGMHTSPEKGTLQREMGMGSHAGAWEPEFCDSLFTAGRMSISEIEKIRKWVGAANSPEESIKTQIALAGGFIPGAEVL